MLWLHICQLYVHTCMSAGDITSTTADIHGSILKRLFIELSIVTYSSSTFPVIFILYSYACMHMHVPLVVPICTPYCNNYTPYYDHQTNSFRLSQFYSFTIYLWLTIERQCYSYTLPYLVILQWFNCVHSVVLYIHTS